MEYTVKKLAHLAGVSARTLRYYDEIGLLKPTRVSSSGYRIYGEAEVDRLQQILFYKALEMPLEEIVVLLNQSDFNALYALKGHRDQLLKKRAQLDLLIETVRLTIESKEGRIEMKDQDKFKGFKQALVDNNEKQYGKEIREKYGHDVVEASNAKVMNMTEAQHERAQALAVEIIDQLKAGYLEGNPAGEAAQRACDLHREWLQLYWAQYSKEAHRGLGDMYVADERFKVYYDQHQEGLAEFFRDALQIFCQN